MSEPLPFSGHSRLETNGLGGSLAWLARILGGLALAAGAALIAMVVALAAAVVALLVLGAALSQRLVRRKSPGGPVLDAQRTPAGWVVETGASPRA